MYLLKLIQNKYILLEYTPNGLIRVQKEIFEWLLTHSAFLKRWQEELKEAMQKKSGWNNQHKFFIAYDNQDKEIYYCYLDESLNAIPLNEVHSKINVGINDILKTQVLCHTFSTLTSFGKKKANIPYLKLNASYSDKFDDFINSLKNK